MILKLRITSAQRPKSVIWNPCHKNLNMKTFIRIKSCHCGLSLVRYNLDKYCYIVNV